MSLTVQTLGANNFVRIEHNWVKPDDFKYQNPGIRLSDYHYWKVDGLFDNTFRSKATFIYDGRTPPPANATIGYVDNTLITQTEDSIVLLYRSGTADEWHVVTDITKLLGSLSDKYGSFIVDTLRKGEYVWGYRDYTLSVPAVYSADKKINLKAFPNPSENICRIEFTIPAGMQGVISVYDAAGKNIYRTNVFSHQTFVTWDCFTCSSGIYAIVLEAGKEKILEKLLLMKK